MSFDLKIANGDISFNASGNPELLFDVEKLKQDLVKIILTPIGSNKIYPWYGSPLSEKAIGKALDKKVLDMEMQSALMYAINNLLELQKLQIKDGQYLSPAESISQVKDLRLEQSIYDFRQFNISIVVLTRRGDVVNESFTLTV